MAEYQMTLVNRQRIARDTMAFWFDTNGANFEFRAGQHADFAFTHPCEGSEATIFGPFRSPARLATKGRS
jgi:ferredoxin-NADP reductase